MVLHFAVLITGVTTIGFPIKLRFIWFFTSHQQYQKLNRDKSSWVEQVLS